MAVAEANRIFGHENWDRETRAPTCIWSDRQRGQFACLYSTQVRISVRGGSTIVTRDGVGTGFGRASSPESAHEMAMKAAETDATKRALATFGNPFGLALYDKKMSQVTKPSQREPARKERSSPRQSIEPKVILTGRGGRQLGSSGSDNLVASVTVALGELETVDAVYAFWEANLANFASVLDHDPIGNRAVIDTVTEKLKARLRDLAGIGHNKKRVSTPASNKDALMNEMSAKGGETTKAKSQTLSQATSGEHAKTATERPKPDQPAPLARAKDRRVRDADHRAFVARHPCVVCGRRPAQAHHIRFAQPRAMAMKVSDEYTVPLCVGHHDALHRTGDERAWWAARKIDPLIVARQLWTAASKSAEVPNIPAKSDDDITVRDANNAGYSKAEDSHSNDQ